MFELFQRTTFIRVSTFRMPKWWKQDPESTVPGSAATWEALVKAVRAMDESSVARTIEENVRYPILDQSVLSYLSIPFLYCITFVVHSTFQRASFW